jgi:hypothetical protein
MVCLDTQENPYSAALQMQEAKGRQRGSESAKDDPPLPSQGVPGRFISWMSFLALSGVTSAIF